MRSADHEAPRCVVISSLLTPLRPKYLPSRPILEYARPTVLLQCEKPEKNPAKYIYTEYSVATWKADGEVYLRGRVKHVGVID